MNDVRAYPKGRPTADELRDEIVQLAPADALDPVIEFYKKDVDRTLLRENLKLTTQQRSEKFVSFMRGIYAMRGQANPGKEVWR